MYRVALKKFKKRTQDISPGYLLTAVIYIYIHKDNSPKDKLSKMLINTNHRCNVFSINFYFSVAAKVGMKYVPQRGLRRFKS